MVRGKLIKTYERFKIATNSKIVVEERYYDHDLTYFDIYLSDKYYGSVFPDDIESMKECRKQLFDSIENCLSWDNIIRCDWLD